jgi:predicted nucleic acid-binding protein
MEVLAGARSDAHLDTIVSILGRGRDIPVTLQHFDDAAAVYRLCRTEGVTVRSMIDCLIAAIAMSEDVELLHQDRDFAAIASVVPLRVHPASMN